MHLFPDILVGVNPPGLGFSVNPLNGNESKFSFCIQTHIQTGKVNLVLKINFFKLNGIHVFALTKEISSIEWMKYIALSFKPTNTSVNCDLSNQTPFLEQESRCTSEPLIPSKMYRIELIEALA